MSWLMREDAFLLRCPACGNVDDTDGFDVGGADPGKLFCNRCNHEAEMPLLGRCEVCNFAFTTADVEDDVTIPADCCERTGLCAHCREKGAHDWDG